MIIVHRGDKESREQSFEMVFPPEILDDNFDSYPRPLAPELENNSSLPTGHITFAGDHGRPIGHILLLAGKPATGKTSISRDFIDNIAAIEFPEFAFAHVSAGDSLRDVATGNTHSRFAQEIRVHSVRLSEAQPLPHSLVARVVQEAIAERDEDLILLDGYPRFEAQLDDFSKLAKQAGRNVLGLVEFTASDEIVIERLLARPARFGEESYSRDKIDARLDEYRASVSQTIATMIQVSRLEYFQVPAIGRVEDAALALSRIIGARLNSFTI